ncbi:MAG: CxxxxCH/CxxCH domain-containing protein, partial [Deltaproteobacteria bacterium]|nr:CxxxxCH/CxxCH domain-containing protein [Deltaproteobacteria bacterium]
MANNTGAGVNWGGDNLDNGTCSTVDCHGGIETPAWGTAASAYPARCVVCHNDGDGGTTLSDAVPAASKEIHKSHVDNAETVYVDDCNSCHGGNANIGSHNGHADLTTTYNAATLSDYDIANTGEANCTNACHLAVTDGDWSATGTLECIDCHDATGKILDAGGAFSGTEATTNKHPDHIGSTYFVDGSCVDCHGHAGPLGVADGHVDGPTATDITMGGNANVSGSPSCTNDCHTLDGADNDSGATGDNPSWTSANALGCEDCHASGKAWTGSGGQSLQRGWPPAQGEHADHFATNYLDLTNRCVECHTDNSAGHASTLDGAVTSPLGTKLSAYTADNCTNTCHVATDTNVWAGASTLVCTDCHTSGKAGLYTGTNDQAPTSGLHGVTNIMAHDDSFDAGYSCTNCHDNSVAPSNTHITASPGTGPENSTQTTYDFTTSLTYDNTNHASGDTGCAASCHVDNAIQAGGKWYRKWLGVQDFPLAGASPGDPVCDNCHNDGIDSSDGTTVDNTWNAGLTPAHLDSPDADGVIEMISQHSQCKVCHGWDDAGLDYDETWGTGDHGNGVLSINGPDAGQGAPGPQGAEYDPTQNGCLAACHQGSLTNSSDPNYNHTMLPDSGWTLAWGDFGSGDCTTCHETDNGADHTGGSESPAAHQRHVDSIGTYVAGCTDCHTHDGISVAPGSGDHANGTVNFTNTGKLGASGSSMDYNEDGQTWSLNCTNTCHASDDISEWDNDSLDFVNSDACVDCHNADGDPTDLGTFDLDQGNYPPDTGMHVAHNTNANSAYVDDCNSCHGTDASTGAHVGHKDNAANITIADPLQSYDTGNDNCTNTCHTAADVGEWLGGTLVCTDCHSSTLSLDGGGDGTLTASVGPPTGKHDAHMINSTYVSNGCTDCHGHSGALGDWSNTGHVNGPDQNTITTAGAAEVLTYPGDLSCTNNCHVVDTAADDGWFDDARTLECDDCHGSTLALDGGGGASITASVGPADAAGRHATHMANTNYVANGCADCHGHSGALGSPGTTFHLNGPANTDTTMAGKASAYNANDTCANSCHAVVDTRDWVEGTDTGTGTALACADCHDADGDPTDLGTYDLDQGEWPPITNAHAEHSASNALPNAT